MQRKKILYFMPDSPVHKDAGNKAHALQILKYFNSRHQQIELDYISEQYWGRWTEEGVDRFKETFPYINVHILERKISKKNKVKYFFNYKLPLYIKKHKWLIKRKHFLPDNNTHILQKSFNNLLKNNQYDYIIISYVTWATLIEHNPNINGARLICDTHDFITAQLKDKKNFKLGETIERETYLLSLFDETWFLSSDELYFFSQFLKNRKHRFIPVLFENNYLHRKKNTAIRNDLLFIGNDNDHNVKSLNWFFLYVYPLLPDSIKICVVGKVTNHVKDFVNVEKHRFVNDLDEIYFQSKIAICPMLSGTGIKIKTVEALSYGLPVVCSLRGLDGLPQKTENGCIQADAPEAFAQSIIALLTDDQMYKKKKAEAINMFTKYFDKTEGHKNLDNIFGLKN